MRGYVPDFKLAFDHICIHTGGRGVIEEIEKQLALTPQLMQPSKDTLFRFGNTSSSSIWCPSQPLWVFAIKMCEKRFRYCRRMSDTTWPL